ncbi:hypothetical protein [Corynebacterium macginleyi]|uniref:hypothetical protein n=1 Tax=Corynebacterium macginleyi TaxID=38290 RepID=UPI00190CCEA8|nr:hypothetical protein [Corynebacterium macginleyi]
MGLQGLYQAPPMHHYQAQTRPPRHAGLDLQQNRYMSLTSLEQTKALITANVIDADTTKEVA